MGQDHLCPQADQAGEEMAHGVESRWCAVIGRRETSEMAKYGEKNKTEQPRKPAGETRAPLVVTECNTVGVRDVVGWDTDAALAARALGLRMRHQ